MYQPMPGSIGTDPLNNAGALGIFASMAPPNLVAQVQIPHLMAISAPLMPSPLNQYSSAHMDSPPYQEFRFRSLFTQGMHEEAPALTPLPIPPWICEILRSAIPLGSATAT